MKVFEHSCYAMGTRFHMVIPNCNEYGGGVLASLTEQILKEEENRLSRYREDSELTAMNRLAFESDFKLSGKLYEVLCQCDQFHKDTRGAFDPAISAYANQEIIAENEEPYKGWKSVTLSDQSIRFMHPGVSIDLGGFGKGWTIERIISCLHNENVESAFLSFGESSISVIGNHPMGEKWKLEIPVLNEGGPLELELSGQSYSISGLKVKVKGQEKQKTAHIYSQSKNGWITEDQLTLVVSQSPLRAEVLSTALMAADNWQKTAILQHFTDEDFYQCDEKGWINLRN